MTTLRWMTAGIAAMSLAVAACRAESHAAPPPALPDLTSYTPVNAADYTITVPNNGRPGPPGSMLAFLTPDGNDCTIRYMQADCEGNNFPGVPPNNQTNPQGVNSIGTEGPLLKLGSGTMTTDQKIQGQTVKLLAPGHSISAYGVICGVDGGGTTACKNPLGRGFILSPQQGTVRLPQV